MAVSDRNLAVLLFAQRLKIIISTLSPTFTTRVCRPLVVVGLTIAAEAPLGVGAVGSAATVGDPVCPAGRGPLALVDVDTALVGHVVLVAAVAGAVVAAGRVDAVGVGAALGCHGGRVHAALVDVGAAVVGPVVVVTRVAGAVEAAWGGVVGGNYKLVLPI